MIYTIYYNTQRRYTMIKTLSLITLLLILSSSAATALPLQHDIQLSAPEQPPITSPQYPGRYNDMGVWMGTNKTAQDMFDFNLYFALYDEEIEFALRHNVSKIVVILLPPSEGGNSIEMKKRAREVSLLSLEHPQIYGAVIDDFWIDFAVTGTLNRADVVEIKALLTSANSNLKLFLVTYERRGEIYRVDPVIERAIDGISFWIFNPVSYSNAPIYIDDLIRYHPGKEIIVGIYISNSAYGVTPIPDFVFLTRLCINLTAAGRIQGFLLFAGTLFDESPQHVKVYYDIISRYYYPNIAVSIVETDNSYIINVRNIGIKQAQEVLLKIKINGKGGQEYVGTLYYTESYNKAIKKDGVSTLSAEAVCSQDRYKPDNFAEIRQSLDVEDVCFWPLVCSLIVLLAVLFVYALRKNA